MTGSRGPARDDHVEPQPPPQPQRRRRLSLGAFDIRTFIGALIGIYGLILVAMGLWSFSATESARTGGVNANLFAGACMVVFAAAMLVWAWLRPVQMPPAETQEDSAGTGDAEARNPDAHTRGRDDIGPDGG